MNNHKLLTLVAAARLVRLPTRWLKDEARAGRLPCLRVGTRILFDRASLERALARLAAGETHDDSAREGATEADP